MMSLGKLDWWLPRIQSNVKWQKYVYTNTYIICIHLYACCKHIQNNVGKLCRSKNRASLFEHTAIFFVWLVYVCMLHRRKLVDEPTLRHVKTNILYSRKHTQYTGHNWTYYHLWTEHWPNSPFLPLFRFILSKINLSPTDGNLLKLPGKFSVIFPSTKLFQHTNKSGQMTIIIPKSGMLAGVQSLQIINGWDAGSPKRWDR